MKKNIILLVLIVLFFVPNIVFAKGIDDFVIGVQNPIMIASYKFCSEDGILKTFQIVGYLIIIIKILVPLLLIIFGSIDFGKAVMSNDDKAINNAVQILVIRLAAGVIVFFVPTLINFAVSLVSSWSSVENEFKNCSTCLFDVDKCSTLRKNNCKNSSSATCSWDSDLDQCICIEIK